MLKYKKNIHNIGLIEEISKVLKVWVYNVFIWIKNKRRNF